MDSLCNGSTGHFMEVELELSQLLFYALPISGGPHNESKNEFNLENA
jgi:hypothetical protein